jgi:hypothetical protein
MSVIKHGHLARKGKSTDGSHAAEHIALNPKLVLFIADMLWILEP